MITSWFKLKNRAKVLETENGALRKRVAQFESSRGADARNTANCDAVWIRNFEELDRDYRGLEKQFYAERTEAGLFKMKVIRALQELTK